MSMDYESVIRRRRKDPPIDLASESSQRALKALYAYGSSKLVKKNTRRRKKVLTRS